MADSAHGAMAVMRQLAENPNLLNAVQGILTIAQSLQNSPAESDNSAARPSAHVAAPSTTRKTSQRRLRNNNNSNSDDVEDDWLDERSQAARRRQRREGVQMHGGDEALFSAPRRAQRGASNSLSTHGSPAPFTTTTLTSSRPAQHIAHEANNLVSRAEMDRQISALTQMLQQKEEEVHQLRTEAQREVEDVRRSFEATIQRKEEEHLHAMKELLRTNQLTITAERFQATIDGARQKQQQQQQQQQYSPMLARRDGSSTTAPALPSSLARYARNDDVEVKMGEVKPEQQRSRSRVVCVKTEDEELYNTPIYGADVVGDDVAGKKMATRVRRAPRTPSHTNADRTRKAQPTNTPTTTTTTTAAHASPAQAAVPITVTRVRTNNNNNNHVGGLWSGASSVANGRTRSPSPVNPKRGIDGPRRFIFTALSDEAEVAELANTIERIGLDAAVLRCGFDEPPPTETTHIVTRGTPRSVKALCGVVAGKWLVPPEYIFNSLRAGFWLDEMEEGGLRVFPTRLRFQRVLLTARDAAIREKLAQVIQYGGGNIIHNSSSQGDGRGRQGDESVVVISSGEDLLRFATQRADA